MITWVPPGGFVSNSQQTVAARAAQGQYARSAMTTRTRRRKKSKSAKKRAKKRASGRKLKFGSPAWRKKFMKGKRKRK